MQTFSQDVLSAMLADGSARIDGYENGEPLYVFNLEIMKDLHPAEYSVLHDNTTMSLFMMEQSGLVNLSWNDDKQDYDVEFLDGKWDDLSV